MRYVRREHIPSESSNSFHHGYYTLQTLDGRILDSDRLHRDSKRWYTDRAGIIRKGETHIR